MLVPIYLLIFAVCVIIFFFSRRLEIRLITGYAATLLLIPILFFLYVFAPFILPFPNSKKNLQTTSVSPDGRHLVKVYSYTLWLDPSIEVYHKYNDDRFWNSERKLGDYKGWYGKILTFWSEDSSEFYMYTGSLCGFAYNLKEHTVLNYRGVPPFFQNEKRKDFLKILLEEGVEEEEIITRAIDDGDQGVLVDLSNLGVGIKPPAECVIFPRAIEEGHVAIVEFFMKLYPQQTLYSITSSPDLLILAVRNGHVDMVKTLLDLGAPVNAKNKDGNCAIKSAFYNYSPQIIHLLIQQGASLDEAIQYAHEKAQIFSNMNSPQEYNPYQEMENDLLRQLQTDKKK